MEGKKIDDGGAAFPRPTTVADGFIESQAQDGMTLRDYFAGQTLLGIVSINKYGRYSPEDAAKDAYQYADAMLAERNKRK